MSPSRTARPAGRHPRTRRAHAGRAFLGAWLLRRRSAAGRYAVWTAAFAGLALLPALTLMLPVLEPPELGRARANGSGRRPAAEARMARDRMRSATRSNGCGHHRRRHDRPMARSRRPDRPVSAARIGPRRQAAGPLARRAAPWLLGLWLAGALFVLARLARDIRRIARVARRAATLRRGPLADLCARWRPTWASGGPCGSRSAASSPCQ